MSPLLFSCLSHILRQRPTFWLGLQDTHFSKLWALPSKYEGQASYYSQIK